jgi:UDP-galactopyranose mutase
MRVDWLIVGSGLIGAVLAERIASHLNQRMIFAGAIDEYFDYVHGPLPYRSLRFEFCPQAGPLLQKVAVVNYPNEYQFTRAIEYRHFSAQDNPATTVAYEYPEPYEPGINTPYHPIPRSENQARHLL